MFFLIVRHVCFYIAAVLFSTSPTKKKTMQTIKESIANSNEYQKINELDATEIENLYFNLMRDAESPKNTMLLDKCEKNYHQLTGEFLTSVIRGRLKNI